MVDTIVFAVSAAIIIGGALGVVFSSHPVRGVLSLIASFFGVAVLFVLEEAHFLALVQVVVYAGAIVVLFLFVIMLLGVDRSEDVRTEPLVGQRFGAAGVSLFVLALLLGGLFLSGPGEERGNLALTGRPDRSEAQVDTSGIIDLETGQIGESDSPGPAAHLLSVEEQLADPETDDVDLIAEDLFGRNVLAFQATALLLTIATIGAVVLVRNRGAEDLIVDEPGTSTR